MARTAPTPHSVSRVRHAARRTTARTHGIRTAAGLALIGTLALPGCGIIPGTQAPAAGGVGFDDVQSAVIQLEARGTFVDPTEGAFEAAGRGSGFLISADGIALTNNHVVVGAGTLDVWRGGDTTKTLNAKVLGSSECLDLAVVQLEGDGYPFLGWHEGDIATATDVYAAGFPLGDPTFTMTRGIVSKASTPGETPWASLDSVIEHDARIRPGNSGGPLVDEAGRIVGVNYAGEDQNDINLAIHRDEVQAVVDDLIAGEDVLSLGINGQAITDAEGTGLGIWVSSIGAGSVADKAGVEPGDVLTSLQGVSVGDDGTLGSYCDVLRTHGTDATLDLELYRASEGIYYRGQVNGDPLEGVQVSGAVTDGDAQATGDFEQMVDDNGNVAAQVPVAWTDRLTQPIEMYGATWSGITATPDIDGFIESWSAPGLLIYATTDTSATTPEAMLAETGETTEAEGCVSDGPGPFEDGRHVGVVQAWTDCGGVGAAQLAVAATSTDGDYFIYLAVQATSDADLAVIDRVLGSFTAAF